MYMVFFFSPIARDNTAAIVGGVLGSIAFLLLVSVIVVLIALFFLGKLSRVSLCYEIMSLV